MLRRKMRLRGEGRTCMHEDNALFKTIKVGSRGRGNVKPISQIECNIKSFTAHLLLVVFGNKDT